MDQKKDNWGLPGWTASASIGESTYNERIRNDRHMSDIRPAADDDNGGITLGDWCECEEWCISIPWIGRICILDCVCGTG